LENEPRYLKTIPEKARLLHTAVFEMRWRDMDAFAHLNNADYFTFYEQARIDWFRSIGAHYTVVMANASCTFLRPLEHPATLEVRLYAGPPGRSSVDSYYEIRQQGQSERLCAIGHGTLVWYDFEASRSMEIPASIRRLLQH
jgi:acyl-CoA thioester hydrolase